MAVLNRLNKYIATGDSDVIAQYKNNCKITDGNDVVHQLTQRKKNINIKTNNRKYRSKGIRNTEKKMHYN